jgi:HK97 family phage portal protein
MNFLQRLNNAIERKGTQPQGTLTVEQPVWFGNDIVYYAAEPGEKFVHYGYNMNDAVYSIVSKNEEKAGQVRLYHAKVKENEKKTLQEYKALTKNFVGNSDEAKEIQLMRKSMLETYDVKSPLSRLLEKPNRNQTQSEWITELFGRRELQGEGNIWFNRGMGQKTLEMFAIPKPQLSIIGNGRDPFEIVGYQFTLGGSTTRWSPDEVIMWIYSNKEPVDLNLEHLRGMAPLQSALLLLQSLIEGDKRMAMSNKNAGAYGFAFWKTPRELNAIQKQDMREKFDNIVNSQEMAGKIAVLSGDWGYHNVGLSVVDQKLLEQYGYGFTRLCRVFKTPAYIFDEGQATWDKARQAYRQWIYSKIAPAMYQLRGLLSDKLIPEFGYDPETNLIDCDIMSLPEMSQDLKELVDSVKEATWLTDDEKRKATGYEPRGGVHEMTQREYDNYVPGGNLDDDEASLNL